MLEVNHTLKKNEYIFLSLLMKTFHTFESDTVGYGIGKFLRENLKSSSLRVSRDGN